MTDFYDQLTPFYHLVHQDWNASMRRQGEQLAALMCAEWPDRTTVLDVSCGIGTQAIALAQQGYTVRASDLSAKEIDRARLEAQQRRVNIDFSVCDMRQAFAHHGTGHGVVLSADNSLPHLLTDQDVLTALRQMEACLTAGGGCLITIRDYALEARGKNILKPYGVREENGFRYVLFQVWDFDGDHYDLTFYFVVEELSTGAVQTHAMRSKYYAISTDHLCDLMREAGFDQVRRIDGAFYQPVLVGTKRQGEATQSLATIVTES